MILAVDIGNTSITCGIFKGSELIEKFSIPSDVSIDTLGYIDLFEKNIKPGTEFEGAIIGSVVDELNNRIQYAILSMYGVKAHVLTAKSKMPIELRVDEPSVLGADRIANGVAGYSRVKGAVIVIDFGTATTFDIVDEKGEFLGGIIAPGVKTQLESLNTSTSKLPDVNIDDIDFSIGKNTRDSILSGVIKGTASMVDGMVANCRKEMGKEPKIIVTGGLGEIISKYMKTHIDMYCPNLTLEGLNLLFEGNRPIQPVFKL